MGRSVEKLPGERTTVGVLSLWNNSSRDACSAAEILLGRPTDHSITFNVPSDQSGQISVEYRTSGAYPTTTRAHRHQWPTSRVRDQRTNDDTDRLRTRMMLLVSGRRAMNTTFTLRTKGDDFAFTVMADSHLNSLGNADRYWQATWNVLVDDPTSTSIWVTHSIWTM